MGLLSLAQNPLELLILRVITVRFANQRRIARLARATKHSIQRVVVGGGNRVILMIMATRTTHCKPKHPTRDHINTIIHDIMNVPNKATPQREVPHRRKRTLILTQLHHIRRKLMTYKIVVRKIFVKRADNIIAIGMGVREISVFLKYIPLRIGIPRYIQPMPSPPFTEVFRGKKPINKRIKRLRRVVRKEGSGFLGRWGHPSKIMISSADKRTSIRLRAHRKLRIS